MIGEFVKQDLQADLGMAVLGTTGLSEVGKTLAKGCYILEKNKFILCCREVYKGQILKIEDDYKTAPAMSYCVKYASAILRILSLKQRN